MEDDEDDLAALYDQSGNVRDAPPKAGGNRDIPEDDALGDLDLEDLMKEARKDLFKDLLKAVRGGYATPAEKNVLRQMLKDNGMVMGDPEEGASDGKKKEPLDLPRFDKPDHYR